MDYKIIEITTEKRNLSLVEAILQMAKISGWTEEDSSNNKKLTFYLPEDEAGDTKYSDITAAIAKIENTHAETGFLKGEEWEETWKKNFKPKKIDGIIVAPPWDIPLAEHGEKIIVIEPGMAFGTGDHATTSLCIELIQKYLKKDEAFLDLGTGSSILSMTAAVCGAGKIVGIDNDPVAVTEAKENLRKMSMSDRIEILLGDAQVELKGLYDIAAANLFLHQVANIVSGEMVFLKKGGIFIGSGITVDQQPEAEKAVENSCLEMLEIRKEGLWIAFAAQKK